MHGYSAVAVAVAVTEAEGVGDATGEGEADTDVVPLAVADCERLGEAVDVKVGEAVAEGVKVGCAGAMAMPRNCVPDGAVGSGDGTQPEVHDAAKK